jgi:acetylserotonin N-methyltransferase
MTRSGLHAPLPLPACDDLDLVDRLGAKGYTDDLPLVQFAAWAEDTGLTTLLARQGAVSPREILAATSLTEAGLDALVGVLASLGLVERSATKLSLTPLAREYLVPGAPFYLGDALYVSCRKRLPAAFVKPGSKLAEPKGNALSRLLNRTLKRQRGWEFGGERILRNQHSRNFPAAVAAAHLPLFDSAQCVVDLAGGSGTFAIPLARRLPEARILLAELPQSLGNTRRFLQDYGVADRVELAAVDAFSRSWPIPETDAIFIGNFAHGFQDERCLFLAQQSLEKLKVGGKLIFHELVWNENKDGPLKTALFNVTMRAYGGSQRSVSEWHAILAAAGFEELFAYPTSGGFVAVGGERPRGSDTSDSA